MKINIQGSNRKRRKRRSIRSSYSDEDHNTQNVNYEYSSPKNTSYASIKAYRITNITNKKFMD